MELNYEQKLDIANKHINKRTMGSCIDWDTLDDINSLHDVDTVEDIIELADERLTYAGFPDEDYDEDECEEERSTTLNEEQ